MSQRTTKAARSAEAAVDRLEKLYAEATAGLNAALDRYLSTGEPPSAATRATFRYPLLRVVHRDLDRPAADAPARLRPAAAAGVYETTVTHPRAFRRYLLEQLNPAGHRNTAPGSRWPSATRRSPTRTCWSAPTRSPAATSPRPTWRGISRRRSCPRSATRSPTANGSMHEGAAAPAVAVRCRARRLFAAPAGALHRQRLAQRAAVDPAHQLPSLRRPVRALGAGATGWRRPLHADGAARRLAHRARRSARARRCASSPATNGTASRCPPITWSRRRARASRWSTSASGRPTPRTSPTTWPCCARTAG